MGLLKHQLIFGLLNSILVSVSGSLQIATMDNIVMVLNSVIILESVVLLGIHVKKPIFAMDFAMKQQILVGISQTELRATMESFATESTNAIMDYANILEIPVQEIPTAITLALRTLENVKDRIENYVTLHVSTANLQFVLKDSA